MTLPAATRPATRPATEEPPGSCILIPPNPGTPTPLAIADFKNGDYSIGGNSVTLSDIFVENTDWASFDATAITDGVGYTSNSKAPVLEDALAADFLTDGFSFLAIFTGGGLLFERVDLPDFMQEAKLNASSTVRVELGAQSDSVTASDNGTQYISGRLSAERMAISANGDPVVAITPDTALIGDHIGFIFSPQSSALEYIEFHAGDLSDEELIAMSVNTFPRISSSAAPAVTGSLTQGETLTCATGTWSNSPTSYTYQWYSGGEAFPGTIAGETSNTYETRVIDIDNNVWCVVTATNATGSGFVESEHVGPITA